MTIERSNAAFDAYLTKIDEVGYADGIREAQWQMVERDGICMDDAFVLAVEQNQ